MHDDHNFTVRRGKRSSNAPKYTLFIILLVASVVGIVKMRMYKTIPIEPAQQEEVQDTIPSTRQEKPANLPPIASLTELASTIKSLIDKQTGSYSVYYEDLTTGRKMGVNETMILTAASVIKVPILAGLYSLADNGTIDLDKRITIQAADIQDYGTGIIRNEGAGGVYSLKSLARLMMEKSDNTAAYILANQIIGLDKLQEMVTGWGLKQTDMANNKTSNLDMAQLLKLMHNGKIANEALTSEMIGFMDDSDFEDRLPALLPPDITIHHKIGNEIGFLHDVGIIELPEQPYYLGVMTSDITDEPQTIQAIAQISKLVFEYQKKQ